MFERVTRSLICAAALALAVPAAAQRLTGLNIAGGEFGDARTGIYGQKYIYPDARDFAFIRANGMNTARVPVKWERLQPQLNGPLAPAELARLDAVVAAADASGVSLIIDIHNYANYDRALVGSPDVPDSAFADLWRRLAAHYKNDRRVIFGLMNEPHGLAVVQWRQSVDAALDAIRAAGARNLVLVPGTRWTGAHSWTKSPGDSNAELFADLDSQSGAVAIEMHQYLDKDSSGTHQTCEDPDAGPKRLAAATDWLRATKHKGFLGEFSASADPGCLAALDRMLSYMHDNADVWLGWTYWAAGRWWGKYPYSVQPGPDGAARPQMDVLRRAVGSATR